MKEKISLVAVALLAYLLPFAAKLELLAFPVAGTEVINDFTKVFLFGADIIAFTVAVFLIVAWRKSWPTPLEIARPQGPSGAQARARFLTGSKSWAAVAFYILFLAFAWNGAATSALGAAMLIRMIIAGMLIWAFLKTPRQLLFSGLAAGLIAGGAVQSVFALIQFITQKSIGLYFLGESPLTVGRAGVATFTLFGEKLLRAYGTLPHPNILAFYLTISLFAALIALKVWPGARKLLITAAIITSIGLLLTFSRLFITLFVLILAAGFILSKQNFSKRYAAVGLGIMVLLLAVIFARGNDQSYQIRQGYDKAYSQMAKTSPWRGVGLGQSVVKSKDAVKKTFGRNYEPWMHQPVHNAYALVKTETGWLGLGLFFLFLIFATNGVLKKLKENPQNYTLAFCTGAAGIILLGMFFEHLFITSPNSLYLTFAVFGLLINAKEARE